MTHDSNRGTDLGGESRHDILRILADVKVDVESGAKRAIPCASLLATQFCNWSNVRGIATNWTDASWNHNQNRWELG